ncbi:MFS transporter [Actinosynnema sp. NPDC047251]|uniref:Permease, MFS-type n=1 Tax=Saccharothrix espanaensis (strain ATCC 51144 / DSM 44229 / JCM 9112 / NBRC 15066 / NRRL 15764) TaxID=1179773 RepID=K0JXT5_SACES|nr:MFS transporter [Saccharothrix espanaensis]CCH32740.1 Permease, MFS-type [Saccharothrix espanaensis DSM 44229]
MTEHANAPAPARAGRREWLGLAMLALPALLVSMDLTVLHLAVPALSVDLRPSSSQLLWVVDVYGFMIAGFLVTMGTLGDRIGRRRLLLIGAAAFGVASALAAFSTSAEMLIAARALLGVAGATLAPSTVALIRNMFHDPRQRTFAISLWFMSFMAGSAVGPLIGGALLEFFWWGSVFLIGVPVMALLLVVGPLVLPEHRSDLPGRLDLVGAVVALAAVLSMMWGLKQVAEHGVALPPLLAVAAGLVLAGWFVRRQRQSPDPLIDLRLFRMRTVAVSLGVLTVGAIGIGGIGYLTAQYLQLVVGLSPLQAGLWMLPPLGAGILTTVPASAVVHRVRPGVVFAVGLVTAAVGLALVGQVTGPHQLALVVIGLVLVFGGLMPLLAMGVDIVVAAAPPERTGAASALSETTQELGIALGIAFLGSLATAVYRGGLPVTSAELSTLGSAKAARLPPDVVAAAESAFTDGLRVASLVSAAALAVSAALAVVLLRRTGPSAPAEEH